jgi:hypothetical protein
MKEKKGRERERETERERERRKNKGKRERKNEKKKERRKFFYKELAPVILESKICYRPMTVKVSNSSWRSKIDT